jgi:hypothetical protein
MMYALIGGKVEINVLQLVSAHRSKDGNEWTLRLTDDKEFTVSKTEYNEIRTLLNALSGSSGVPPLPVGYQITLTGTATPPV